MSKYVEKQPEVEAWAVPTDIKVEGKPTPATTIKIGETKFPAGVDSGGAFIRVGGLAARPGDFIVTHSSGLVEVLKPSAFVAKYEPVAPPVVPHN